MNKEIVKALRTDRTYRTGSTVTETLEPMAATEVDQKELAEQLLAQAKEQGIELMGPNGLLNQLTKNPVPAINFRDRIGTSSNPRWMRRWPNISATRNMTLRAAAAATHVTAPVRRRC